MIKRKGDWFYYYDSDKNVMGKMNIKTHKFVGDTAYMIKLYDHIMMIKKEVTALFESYPAKYSYTFGICHAMGWLRISKETKSFVKSKFPKEYYDCFGSKLSKATTNAWRFPNGEKRKEFLDNLNKDYGITTTINETV